MTKKMTSSRSTTLALLLNTLTRFLDWLKSRNECWQRHRKSTIARRKFYRRTWWRYRRDWDLLNERVVYNDGLVVAEVLIADLIDALERNPYPGEKWRVLDVVRELFPGATVILYPGSTLSGEKLWLEVFEIGGVDHRERLRFPVKEGELDVADMEQLLYEHVREDGTLPAIEVPKLLKMKANSKDYRLVKVKLEERNWQWKQRKEAGKVVKIVVAPG